VRIGWDRGCLYGDGRQSHQARQRRNDHSHFSLCLGGTTRQSASEWVDKG
jgi:hypothetical protein